MHNHYYSVKTWNIYCPTLHTSLGQCIISLVKNIPNLSAIQILTNTLLVKTILTQGLQKKHRTIC